MGSGASSQVQEGIQGKSIEDLAAALKEMPPESYQKVANAVTIAEGGSAPFLKKAFEVCNKVFSMMTAAEISGEMPDMDFMEKMEEEYKDNLKKSFRHHDKDSSGKLDKGQSALFFSHLLSEGSGFMDAMCNGFMKVTMQQMKAGLTEALAEKVGKDSVAQLLPGALKVVEGEMKKVEATIHESTEKLKSDYVADKAAKDAEAMKITDTDGSGSLDLEEFLAMMDFGEALNLKLMECLGIQIDPEKMMENVSLGDLETNIEEYMTKEIGAMAMSEAQKLAPTLTLPEGSEESSAPWLKKAFETISSIHQMVMANPGGDIDENAAKSLDIEYKACLIRSFKHHDKDCSGKLDKDQAATFFSHLLGEGSLMVDAMCEGILKLVMAAMKSEISAALVMTIGKDNVAKLLPGAMKLVEDDIKEYEAAVRELTNKKKEEYAATKAEKDAEALKATDTDGSGSLTLEEFMAMMDIGSEQNNKIMGCLGITMDIAKVSAGLDEKFSGLEKKMEEYMTKEMAKLMEEQPAVPPEV